MPFEELTGLLQQEGFLLKPDDYIEILKIVENYGGRNINALKFRLAPLVCNNETEQLKFYRIFDEYAKITKEIDIKPKNRFPRRLVLIAALFIAFLLFALIGYFLDERGTAPPPASFTVSFNGQRAFKQNIAAFGDTITLDASGVLSADHYDTSDLRLAWDTGNGWKPSDQPVISFRAGVMGGRMVKLKLQSAKHPNYLSEDSQYISICSGVITALESNRESPFHPGDAVSLQAVVRGKSDFIQNPLWVVNDVDTLNSSGQQLSYRFDTAGRYSFTFLPQGKAAATACTQSHTVAYEVNKKNESLQLTATTAGKPVEPESKLNSWLWLLLLLPLAAMIIINRLQQRAKRKSTENIRREAITENATGTATLTPPVEVPFKNNDLQYIAREPEMNLLFRAMRNKTEDECRVLDISKSIRSEMKSGGMPSLIFTNRMKQQEYLILVDKLNPESKQLNLFQYLVRLLCDENLNIERFYYQDFSSFYNEQFPSGITLQRLADLYKTDVLIILGDAHQLIYPAWPAIKKEVSALLNEWEFKAILTPRPYPDWGVNETALKKEVVLLPADIKGQVQLLQAIKEKQLKQDKYLGAMEEFYDTGSYYFTDVSDIKTYLADATLFQWLCAVCVYPKVRWEIMIEVGKQICKAAGEEGKLNFSNLLKLVRMDWMQEGIIPERTRLELLKHLTVPNEVLARETVISMLATPELFYKGDYFFLEEKQQQEITNKFVLFAHDNTRYPEYAAASEVFRARWEQNRIHDSALKRYLDKQPGDNWETPLGTRNNPSTGVKEYFSKSKATIAKSGGKFRFAYASAVAALIILLVLMIFGKNILDGKSIAGIPLTITDTAKLYNLSFEISTDSCIQVLSSFREGITGNLNINENEYPLSFSSLTGANVAVPYYDARAEEGIIELSMDNGNMTVSQLVKLAASTYLELKNCAVNRKPVMSIRFFNPAGNDSLRLVSQMIATQFDISEQQSDSTTITRIVYYSNEDAAKADSIALLVATVLNRKIPVQYLPVKSSSVTAPVLYLSFPAPETWTVLPVTSLPASLNEIWKGSRNNRLITIDLVDQLIWYSTGSKTNYGTYRILQVSRKGNLTKIITNANDQFAVFYLQNIVGSGFQLCFQPVFLKTKEEAEKQELADCRNSLDEMRLYYPPISERLPSKNSNNAIAGIDQRIVQRFYFRLSSSPLFSSSEIRLLQGFLKDPAGDSYEKLQADVKFNMFWNDFKLLKRNLSIETGLDYVNGIIRPLQAEKMVTRQPHPNGTPFDRDYVDVTVTRRRIQDPPDPCKTTYRNIDEALKAGNACRLDLSDGKLDAIPASLVNLTSLQFLDMRNNYLSADDSIRLVRMFPKTQVLFSPQRRNTEPAKWVYLQTIELEKNIPAYKHQAFLNNLSNQLRRIPAARIKIVVSYETIRDSQAAANTASELKNYLLKMYKLASDKIVTETIQSGGEQQQQQQQQQQNQLKNSSGIISGSQQVAIYAINLPSNKN